MPTHTIGLHRRFNDIMMLLSQLSSGDMVYSYLANIANRCAL